MKLTQSKVLDAGRRVQDFLNRNAAKVTAVVSALVRSQLDAAVARIEGFKAQQDVSHEISTGETGAQKDLRASIYESFLKPIGVIAEQALPGIPDLGTLTISADLAIDGRRSDFETKVENMIVAVAKYQQTFSDRGLPDIGKQLGDALTAFKASEVAQSSHRNRRVAATSGLVAMENSLRKTLALLDSLVTPALVSDADLLAAWQTARRIHKTAVVPNPTGEPQTKDQGETPAAKTA
jgi:hypothetical protein